MKSHLGVKVRSSAFPVFSASHNGGHCHWRANRNPQAVLGYSLRRSIVHAASMTIILVTGWAVSGCHAPSGRARVEARFTMHGRPEAGALTADQQVWAADLCAFGVPKWTAPIEPTDIVVRQGYALEHHAELLVPLWVCEHLESSDLVKNPSNAANRDNCSWHADDDIPAGRRAEPPDYVGVGPQGFDRGHNAPSSDYDYSQDRMCDTFFLSNIAPQRGKNFNQRIWRVLEDRVQAFVKDNGEAWIVTGTMFYDPKEDDPDTADGIVEYETAGNGEIPVPTHFYKIVLAKDNSQAGTWKAVAFIMENKDYERLSDKEYVYCGYIKDIDWLERRSGFDFFPDAGVKINEAAPGECWPAFKEQS